MDKLQFIIPRNYKESEKLFGIIRYSTLIIICIYGGIIWLILRLINVAILIKIYFFMTLFIPVCAVLITGFANDSIIDFIRYMYKYHKRKKVYIFKK